MADLTHPKLVVAIVVAVIAVAAMWIALFIARWRRITWRDQMDAKLGELAISKNAVPSSPFNRCEVTDTNTLLQRVNSIQGAIGYAQVSDASAYPNVTRININGREPSIDTVEAGTYAYWTVEYLYTAGVPAPGSLAADFLQYVKSITASDILLGDEYTPCIDRGRPQALCTSDNKA